MRNRTKIIVATALLLAGYFPVTLFAQAKKFPKISWVDPYWLLSRCPSQLNEALTYYGQMESLGVNIVASWLESANSSVVHNLVYYNNRGPVVNGIAIQGYTATGSSVIYQAEETDPLRDTNVVGYSFTPTTGQLIHNADANGTHPLFNAIRGQTGVHSPGYLVANLAYRPKSVAKVSRFRSHFAKFRLKVSNNTLPDTVCDLYFRLGSVLIAQGHLRANSFSASNQFQEFEISGPSGDIGSWLGVGIEVYWRGNVDLYVDQIDWRDGYSYVLFGMNTADVDNGFIGFYNSIDTTKPWRMAPTDEAVGAQYRTQLWFESHSSIIGSRGRYACVINLWYDFFG